MFGTPPTSDATGRFTVDQVAAGSGTVALMSKNGGMKPLGNRAYVATEGQTVDVGTIKVVPPPSGDMGTLGMATELEATDLAVTIVQAGGPAAAAGIVVGDRITAVQGSTVADLTPPIAQQVLASGTIAAGQTVQLTLARGPTVAVTAAKW